MAVYIIAEHKITDAAKFEEYRTKVGPMIAKHGGRYLTKRGRLIPLSQVNQNLGLAGQIRNGAGFEFFGRS